MLAAALDGSLAAVTPALVDGVYVTIGDYHSNTYLMAKTAISSLTNPTSFTLPHSCSLMVNSGREFEYRFLIFEYTWQTSNYLPSKYVYKINNLPFYP